MIKVRYVDGREVESTPAEWSALRSEGVDYFDVRNDGQAYRIQGRSMYWLYREDGLYVAGGGVLTGIEEVLARPGGEFELRQPHHAPDLTHDRVKLGWWSS